MKPSTLIRHGMIWLGLVILAAGGAVIFNSRSPAAPAEDVARRSVTPLSSPSFEPLESAENQATPVPASGHKNGSSDVIVHEWGTFLGMTGSDGTPLDGMYHEEHALPAFV